VKCESAQGYLLAYMQGFSVRFKNGGLKNYMVRQLTQDGNQSDCTINLSS